MARAIAAAGMVLLKNENDLLPLSRPGPIVLSGPGVDRVMYGAGSAEVNQGQGNISLLKGMREQFGDSRIEVVTPEATIPGDAALFVYAATAVPGQEGTDAEDIAIPSEQIAQIKSLANKTDRLLVLVQTATATDLSPIVREADAMIVAWFGGQEFGRAAADIISGKTAPQGRLPVTLARSLGDYPAAVLKTWPGRLIFAEHPGGGSAPVPFDPQHRFPVIAYKAHYLEGTLIGYRWFDKQNIAVNYPFGFGLTYTTFSLSGLDVLPISDGYKLRIEVKNTGRRSGVQIVQAYVSEPATPFDRPDRRLVGFENVTLKPAERKEVYIDLPKRLLAHFQAASQRWVLEPGRYRISVGTSSSDLPLAGDIEIETSAVYDHP